MGVWALGHLVRWAGELGYILKPKTLNSNGQLSKLGMFPLILTVLNGEYNGWTIIPIKDC